LRALRVAFQHVKTVGIRNKLLSKLYQHLREYVDMGSHDSEDFMTYIPHISNVIFPELALRFLERGQ